MRIQDLRVDPHLHRTLEVFRPECCGIGCAFTTEVGDCLEIARAVKAVRPNRTVMVGGAHPSLRPQDFGEAAVDVVVVGEAEAALPELFAALSQQREIGGVPQDRRWGEPNSRHRFTVHYGRLWGAPRAQGIRE